MHTHQTSPASISAATRCARDRSDVQIAAPSPYLELLARATPSASCLKWYNCQSSSVVNDSIQALAEKRLTTTTGPNISSCQSLLSTSISAITVGAKKLPRLNSKSSSSDFPVMGIPPARMVPSCTCACMTAVMRSRWCGEMTVPMVDFGFIAGRHNESIN
jgi:hypothetical protein